MSPSEAAANLARELRVAARRLLRRPSYALAQVTLLAVSIGMNTAVFSLFDALFLRPLPFGESDRLVTLSVTFPAVDGRPEDFAASPLDFVRWREKSRLLQDIAAATPRDLSLADGTGTESVRGEMLSASTFRLLGTRPILGRVWSAEEDRLDSDVVVLSRGLWTRRFGSDPGVVGRRLRIDGVPRAVLGVMPEEFQPTFSRAEAWLPLGIDAGHLGRASARYLATSGRLAPGTTIAQAQAELSLLNDGLRAESPDTHKGWGVHVLSLRENFFGPRRPALLMLLAAVAAVLVIACSNLAHLALAHAIGRRGDFSLRQALGASRSQVMREPVLEAVVLSAVGGALGVLLAFAVLPPTLALDGELARFARGVRPDLAVLAFAAAATLGSTVVTGLFPAWRATQGLPAALGAAGARVAGDRAETRLRQALVVVQVMTSLVLLSGAGLLVEAVLRLQSAPRGFRSEGLVAAQLVLPAARYEDAASRAAFVQRVLERAQALPGVTAAATTMTRFASTMSMRTTVLIEGRPLDLANELTAHYRRVTPGYARVMGARLVAGREFEPTDAAGAPLVALVSESFARRYLPGQDPIGLRVSRTAAQGKWLTVVGVVGDVMDSGLAAETGPTLYVPYAQNNVAGMSWAPVTLLLRGSGGAASLAAAARAAVAAADPDLALEPPATVEEHLAGSLAPQRLEAGLLGLFALTAVVLAVVGLYGVTAYGVAQRRREMGIRAALGASGGALARMVLAAAMRSVAIGLALGALGTWMLPWMLDRALSTAPSWHGRTVAAMAVLLGLVAAAAAYLPARRSARLDPVRALREG